MGINWVAGLSRGVDAERAIPVGKISNDAKRRANILDRIVIRIVDGEPITSPWQWADIKLRTVLGIDRFSQRVTERDVVIAVLSVDPFAGVCPKAFSELVHCLSETIEKKTVTTSLWIGTVTTYPES